MVRVETRDRNLCCVPSFNWSDLFMAGIRHFSSSWETEAMPVAFFLFFLLSDCILRHTGVWEKKYSSVQIMKAQSTPVERHSPSF